MHFFFFWHSFKLICHYNKYYSPCHNYSLQLLTHYASLKYLSHFFYLIFQLCILNYNNQSAPKRVSVNTLKFQTQKLNKNCYDQYSIIINIIGLYININNFDNPFLNSIINKTFTILVSTFSVHIYKDKY